MKNLPTKPTVTVAISAYNEGCNINAFLKSVLKQKEEGFILKEIWIYSDGSTDNTTSVVNNFKSNKIKLFHDEKRLGKSTRLNSIYKNLQTDFLVQSDADVILKSKFTIRDLINPLIKYQDAGMSGGSTQPIPGKTFTEKAVNCTVEAFKPLRTKLRNGNNIFSVDGRLLAYKKELVKMIYIPENMTSNDKFTYFSCIINNYKYFYVPSAIVLYRSPTTLSDQLKQEGRFAVSYYKHLKYFPASLVQRERYIPKNLKLQLLFKQFLKHPIMCLYIYFINLYLRRKAKEYEKEIKATWPIAFSTKQRIIV